MTEYTPTTEEVRRCYGDIHCSDLSAGTLDRHECPEEAEFDRWLNEIRAEAWDEGYQSSGANQANHENWECGVISGEEFQKRRLDNPYHPNEK